MNEPSFMKTLFFGVIAEESVFPYPHMEDAEQRRVHELIERFQRFAASEIDSRRIDVEARIDDRVVAGIAELGLFGVWVPREYGGLGLSATGCARVLQEVAGVDASLGVMLVVHAASGLRGLVLEGTEAQKQELLPACARGERIAAFALAEAAGSDPAGIRTHAELDGARGVYKLRGKKPWVTNGDRAGLVTVFARTTAVDEGQKPKLIALLVKREDGFVVGARRETLGVRGAAVHELSFDGVEVPASAVLGEPGKGYKLAQLALDDQRLVMSAALVGQSRALIGACVLRLGQRRSFGRAIGEFAILQDKVSRMLSDAYAIESLTYLTTGMVDRGVDDTSIESAICRVAASEALWRIVNEAMQIEAGEAFLSGSLAERHLRDARAAFVLDGTNETLRCFIALSGLRGPAQRIAEVSTAINEPVKGFGLLRDFALRKVKEQLRRERLAAAHPLLAREAVAFEECADALSQAALRVLRDHGTEIAEMQYAQMRVANTAIDLYALVACLARTSRNIVERGESGARRMLDVTTMFASAAERRMRANIAGLGRNDDELRRQIAARIYTDGDYPFDVF